MAASDTGFRDRYQNHTGDADQNRAPAVHDNGLAEEECADNRRQERFRPRTEAFLTAIVGALFFGEAIVMYGWGAILISVSGVILITVAKTGIRGGQLLTLLADKSAWIGIVCGLFFAIASLTMRKATLMLGMEDFLFRGRGSLPYRA